ncbi:lissencephaly-1 homolog [Tripterygium wilfordii]|nr:lissencephaly-1 homolog [Tripterygium wilfordii]
MKEGEAEKGHRSGSGTYCRSPDPEFSFHCCWFRPSRLRSPAGDCPVNLMDDSDGPLHNDSIRAIRYGASGKLFVSAGDDKLVKIWSAESWHCICTVNSEKRVTAVAISNDDLYVCFADKFGVVSGVDLHGLNDKQALVNMKPVAMLAHPE